MPRDASRLQVAIVEATHFGRTVLADLFSDEGVRDIEKFSDGRKFIAACQNSKFDLVLVDDLLPDFSVSELVSIVKADLPVSPLFISLQSDLGPGDVLFLKQCGVGGVLLKPVAPKRFSALFRAMVKVSSTLTLAA